jgi:hypothetical protein
MVLLGQQEMAETAVQAVVEAVQVETLQQLQVLAVTVAFLFTIKI